MKKLIAITGTVVLVASVTACEPYGTGPEDASHEAISNTWLPATYVSEWVGAYVGSGTVELLETGSTYSNVSVCAEIWMEELELEPEEPYRYLLANIYFSSLPAPPDLEAVSDGYYVGNESECAGVEGSLVLQGFTWADGVSSRDTLSMYGPPVYPWPEKWQQIWVRRHGQELVWQVKVTRYEYSPNSTYSRYRKELARLQFATVREN